VLRLSVLDQSPIRAGGTAADAVAETLELAQACRPGAFPSVEEAESYPYNEQGVAIAQHARRRTIAGAPEQVRERLTALAHEYGADELKVVTIAYDFKARLRSYQLLAEVFGLPDRWSGQPLPEASP
jgi:alkanesulfonate monooxygenase SsuD/methylene tetrahydromethanopterin reductase-like flavin-dependent oxidoreductase (luciferase family)